MVLKGSCRECSCQSNNVFSFSVFCDRFSERCHEDYGNLNVLLSARFFTANIGKCTYYLSRSFYLILYLSFSFSLSLSASLFYFSLFPFSLFSVSLSSSISFSLYSCFKKSLVEILSEKSLNLLFYLYQSNFLVSRSLLSLSLQLSQFSFNSFFRYFVSFYLGLIPYFCEVQGIIIAIAKDIISLNRFPKS